MPFCAIMFKEELIHCIHHFWKLMQHVRGDVINVQIIQCQCAIFRSGGFAIKNETRSR